MRRAVFSILILLASVGLCAGGPGYSSSFFYTLSAGTITSSGVITGSNFVSTVATGTAPFASTSTTLCTNLNADTLDGISSAAFGQLAVANTWTAIQSSPLATPSPNYTTATFSGAGLNDLTVGTGFSFGSSVKFIVKIDGTGTPDTFKWSNDGGSTWAVTGVNITGSAQTLGAYGITITFAATTGHTLNDQWTFYGLNYTGSERYGYNALNTAKGTYSTAFGNGALASNNYIGNGNSAFGYAALGDSNAGYGNSAFGQSALRYNDTGIFNAAFGAIALNKNTTGSYNCAFGGYDTCEDNTIGNSNNGFGYGALRVNESGSGNVAVGSNTLLALNGGSYNIALGFTAGDEATSGDNNILIGKDVQKTGATASNEINIGNVIKATGINTPATATITLSGNTTAPYVMESSALNPDAPRGQGGLPTSAANTNDYEGLVAPPTTTWRGTGPTPTASNATWNGYYALTFTSAGTGIMTWGLPSSIADNAAFKATFKISAPNYVEKVGVAFLTAAGNGVVLYRYNDGTNGERWYYASVTTYTTISAGSALATNHFGDYGKFSRKVTTEEIAVASSNNGISYLIGKNYGGGVIIDGAITTIGLYCSMGTIISDIVPTVAGIDYIRFE